MTASRPVALVTGARRGIGRACAEALARIGFNIAASDLVVDAAANEAEAAIRSHGAETAFFEHDIAAVDSHAGLLSAVIRSFGRLDCLINNAGRGAVLRGDLLDLLPQNFDAVLNVNLRGSLFLTQAAARAMLERPGLARTIIFITSVSAELVSPERTEYCVSKAALSTVVKAFALRLARERIGVFEVRPGIIRTDMTGPVADRYDEAIANGLVPMHRWGEVGDVADVVAGLATGQFAFATGTIISADGGLSLPRL
jgi:3-oxoacyl-[acyl-carrier protein] reductase